MAWSGTAGFSHVSVKQRRLQSRMSLWNFTLALRSSSLFSSDWTLASRMLGRGVRCARALSLFLTPARFPLGRRRFPCIFFFLHSSTRKKLVLIKLKLIINGSFYKCEEGWEKHGGKCYYFSISQLSWKQSRVDCRAKGGDLVKIDSREEQLMKEGEDKFWIGLTDSAVEGRWLWVDGSLLKFWAGKEPNNVTEGDPDGEDCVRMGEEFENKDLKCWFDQSCLKPQRSICEKFTMLNTRVE
uniref:C-type lectin domain-containing protein n=1 Tax=Astatotilapia calliptera TaxID=8154 RepID=A0A3P8QRA0_ASTCA